jgi:hypothetical protein
VFLDPLAAIGDVVFFIAVTLLTMRRARYGVCVLIAVQPFALYQGVLSTTITLPKIALLAVLLGLSAYREAFAPVASRTPWRIVIAGVLVLGATLLSFVHAHYQSEVLRQAFKMVEYIVLFCAVVAAYRLDPDRVAVRRTVLATTIAVALLALAQEAAGAPSVVMLNHHLIPRIAGPLEGPNQLAGYFDIALPLVFALAIDEPSATAHIVLFLIVFTDVLTLSRGGLIGGVAAVMSVALVMRRNLRAGFIAMGAGLAAAIGAGAALSSLAHGMAFSRFLNLDQSDYAGGVGTRSELWSAAWKLWLRHPAFGVGAGNFEREIGLTGVRGVRTHANSLYLQSLAEGGIFLFAATLWLVYTSIASFARRQMRSPFVLAAFAASVALALHQVVDFLTFYPKVGGEWWIVMGLGAAELAAFAPVEMRASA